MTNWTRRLGRFGLPTLLAGALVACQEAGTTESSPNPGEEQLDTSTSALSVSKTLYYEGACWWLRCANGNQALGACGYGCNDLRRRLARDFSWRLNCNQQVQITKGNITAWGGVWDQSCCGRMEGNDALLNALGIPHGDGRCVSRNNFSYGWGQALATFVY